MKKDLTEKQRIKAEAALAKKDKKKADKASKAMKAAEAKALKKSKKKASKKPADKDTSADTGVDVKVAAPKKTLKKKSSKKGFKSISTSLLALCLLPMLIVCVIITIVSSGALRSGIESEIEKSLKIVATSVNETYTNLYEGDYSKDVSGKLYKGDIQISGNTDLIDGLKEQTGFEVSFFFGNMRLLTTINRTSGGRATGTNIPDSIFNELLTGNPVFQENMEIQDNTYYVYYQPLFNSNGSVVGTIEVAMDSKTVNSTIRSQVVKIIILSVVFLVLASFLTIVLSRGMVRTMRRIKDFLQRLMNGELTAVPNKKEIKRKDELGDIYNISIKLQSTLLGIVKEIKDSSNNLIASADSLAEMAQATQDTVQGVETSVDEISKGARVQAQGTSDAQDSITNISNQIELISSEVDSLTEYARTMSDTAKASEAIIAELSNSTEDTKESISKVEDQIIVMNESVKNIQTAVTMIQSIAEETDLLSLNASIEAARAGDAGKGFGVVAEQICKLADQSNRSTKEIEQIIANVMQVSAHMVEIMLEVKDNMNEQQDKLEETKVKYTAVTSGVEGSLTNIDSIKSKMDILNDSETVIIDVVKDLAAISEENAASASTTMEVASGMSTTVGNLKESSDKLLELAEQLDTALGVFKL